MLKNYIKTAYRHLLKNKFYSLINILGLTFGMAACLFIFHYVHFELSYDSFHEHASDLYRVPFDWNETDESGEKISLYASNVPAFGPAVSTELPEVVASTRLFHVLTTSNSCVLSYEQPDGQVISFHEEQGFYADSTFFSMFTFPLRYGNPATALTAPNSIVLTTGMAEKYFGRNWEHEVPLGKTIAVNGMHQEDFKVTGIMEEVPANSHVQFDFLLSYASFGNNGGVVNSWVWSQCYAYIQLVPHTEPEVVNEKLKGLIDKYYEWENKPSMFLQPITSIYLDSDLRYEIGATGSRNAVYFLSIVGIFILVIGWINYLNLTLAKSADRAKEVGVRKVVGASQKHLIFQFMIESVVINSASALLAVLMVVFLQPWVADFLAWQVPNVHIGKLLQSPIYGIPYPFIVLFLAGSIISALYPALIITNAHTLSVQKQKITLPRQGIAFRKVLVTSQFMASTVLIFGALIVNKQLSFMQQKDLGMSIDQVLVLKTSRESDSVYQAGFNYFKNEVKNLSAVSEATSTTFIPGKEITYTRGMQRMDGETKKGNNFFFIHTDENFAPTLGLDFVAGRNFSKDFATDQTEAIILNEAAIDMLGYNSPEEALHQKVRVSERGQPVLEIVGVIKNYHQKSLQQAHETIALRYAPATNGYVVLNIKSEGDIHHTMAQIQLAWSQAFPASPFDYFFLDDFFNRQYLADRQFNKVFSTFTALAIFIASLGLFGLASYTAVQRTKEIGIRKVLGASVMSILVLLSKEYIKLILIAFVIAIPVANYFFSEWLNHFAYRTQVHWWIFAIPGILVLLIALLSVGGQTIKAARRNPVDSLRYE